jgi:REP element-mobilizing transposase RayT
VSLFPLSYHLTFGTYGTRLHGDPRGTVDRSLNKPGDPIVGHCADWQRMELNKLKFPPRILTLEQQLHIQWSLPQICARGGWTYIECAGAPDHIHVVLSAEVEGDAIRKWLKRWLGESLTSRWPLRDDETWWAESGSIKWIWTAEYLGTVTQYVRDQRAAR